MNIRSMFEQYWAKIDLLEFRNVVLISLDCVKVFQEYFLMLNSSH